MKKQNNVDGKQKMLGQRYRHKKEINLINQFVLIYLNEGIGKPCAGHNNVIARPSLLS